MTDKDKSKKDEEIKEKKKQCFFCYRNFVINDLNNFSNCNHYICNLCLFERIFSDYITEIQGQKILTISCKCEKSTLDLEMSDILEILTKKRKLDLNKVIGSGFENIEQTIQGCECKKEYEKRENKDKQLFSDYFCLDCLKWICSDCISQVKNAHYNHRVLKSRYLIKYMKDNIQSIFIKNKNSETFEKKWEEKANQFQKIISNEFAETVKKLNELIDSAIKLRDEYIKKYKEQMEDIIKAFKIIKIYYLNYFTDKSVELKKINAENNDIFKLKYLANISHDFIDFNLEHYKFNSEIENIKNEITNFNSSINDNKLNLIKGNFIFDKIEKGYILDEATPAHNKFITGLIKLNNKIISASFGYELKIWENETGTYKIKQSLKKGIVCLLGLKNGKIFVSVMKTNDISIYEVNERGEYYNSQSLSSHDQPISAMIELEDGKIVSGSIDQQIIIWEEDEKLKQYMVIQKIKKNKPIILLMGLNNFHFAYILKDDKSQINIMKADYDINEKGRLHSNKFTELSTLKIHRGKVNCLCPLDNEFIASGGGDDKEVTDHDLYIWKPYEKTYKINQCILNAHEADINSIIQLRNGNIASSSKDRTIHIWKINKSNIENKIEYVLIQNLNHYQHGLYKLIQLDDDRIVVASSDNHLIFWRSNASII